MRTRALRLACKETSSFQADLIMPSISASVITVQKHGLSIIGRPIAAHQLMPCINCRESEKSHDCIETREEKEKLFGVHDSVIEFATRSERLGG